MKKISYHLNVNKAKKKNFIGQIISKENQSLR